MGIKSTKLSDLLNTEPLAEIVAAGQPVFATSGRGKEAVWANKAALALLGVSNLHDLTDALNHSTDPAIRQLSRLGARLQPGGAAQLQKIRFKNTGPAGVLVTVRCWSVALQPADASTGGDDTHEDKQTDVFFAAALDAPSHLRKLPDEATAPMTKANSAIPDEETAVAEALGFANAATQPQQRSGNVRFMWRSDAAGRLQSIDGALCEVLGCDTGALIGKSFDELIESLPLEPGAPLRAALARRDTWSRIEVLWPFTDSTRRAPVTLGGLPSFGRNDMFDGYSGFGVIHLDDVVDRPVRVVATNGVAREDSGSAKSEHGIAGTDSSEAAIAEDASITRHGDASNVVSLRAWQTDNQQQQQDEATAAALAAKSKHQSAGNDAHAGVDDGRDGSTEAPGSVSGTNLTQEAGQESEQESGQVTPAPDVPIASDVTGQSSDGEQTPEAAAPETPGPSSDPAAPLNVDESKDDDESTIQLSDNERNAFREIARALGARERSDTDNERLRSKVESQAESAIPEQESPGEKELDAPQSSEKNSGASAAEENAAALDAAAMGAAEPDDPIDEILDGHQKAKPLDTVAKFRRAIESSKIISGNRRNAGRNDIGEDASDAQDKGDAARNTDRETAADYIGTDDINLPEAGVEQPGLSESPAAVIPADREIASLLDRIGLGLLTIQNGTVVFINQPLVGMLGYETSDAFQAAGGLNYMFRGRDPETLAREAVGGAIPVITATGDVLAMEGKMHAASWKDKPATLLTLQPSQMLEREARLRSLELDIRKRESEVRELHSILDTATDGVALLDEEGRILSLNGSGQALFGYDQNEVAGEKLTILLARDSQSTVMDYFAGLKGEGVKNVLNDGREVQGRASKGGAIPLFMTIGRITATPEQRFCAVLRDVTQWKKAERELSESRQEAERTSSLKSEFLAKISHEVRTPLNAILGFTEVIIDERFGPVENERYKDYLKDIHASGTHVLSLINDLLDLSKIEAGKLELEFGSVDPSKIVNECVSIMQSQALRERVILRLSLAPRLPNIVADERSLRQIVLNILSNAVKFNEPGGQIIVSTALTDAGAAVIRIRDTGIGMSEKEVETALEPFRQVATSRKAGGTGLGLPLTKALVEANRASFTIKSKKDEGTLVEVSFPQTRVLAE